jgi:hypothetical protein
MSNNQPKVLVSPEVWEQVQAAMRDLLTEPLPPYSTLGLQITVHDGTIRRLKPTREIQTEVKG